jgi:eukaryotic-like serine/threonine-protein kinase
LNDVGPYTLGSLIGVGGMGEVYRARDSRLGRDVALKILPAAFAADRDRVARFNREAQVLAALNHPNIASIYGLERDGPTTALVLELVEGPTLADRLMGGALPLDDAVAIAVQIADALAAAHDAGVVHRDLKPANVKVRDDGTVKVLDFGLAKIAEAGAATATPLAQSPTITTPAMTMAGIILGTAAYMSPEQAKGKAADRRSDIWSFGCVLFEMLTGRRAFAGDDASDTLAAILRSEPDWTALGPAIPSSVVRVVRRCLHKEPGRRYQAIADARLDLAEPPSQASLIASGTPRGLRRERAAWTLLAATLAGGLIAVAMRKSPPPSTAPPIRFQVPPPEKGFFGSLSGIGAGMSGATISPDGTRLAFVATDASGHTGLWVRPLESNVARPVPDTDNASLPFWSPDGRSIGFFAAGKLKSADAVTGALRVIADAPVGSRGASWGSRGVIVFSRGNPPQLARVSAEGSAISPLLTGTDAFNRQPLWPHFLPDGRHFIYWSPRLPPDGAAGIVVASIDPDFEARLLVRSDTAGVVMPPGTLVFGRGETVFQQPFDFDRFQISGEPIPINEPILIKQGIGIADFTLSATAGLVYQPATSPSNQFAWVDRSGRRIATVGAPGRFRSFDLSPDGKRLAYEDTAKGDIWILDLDRQTPSRFTSDPEVEACPVWFPDGSKIAYRRGSAGVFVKDANGTTPERRLLNAVVNGPTQVTPDGKGLLTFWVPPGGRSNDVVLFPLTGEPTPRTIVGSPFPEVEPRLSPDGRWLAYASSETGQLEIYVQPFPPTGARWQISSAGGHQPFWRGDGKELFFVADDRRFYAVDVRAGQTFDYGVPHVLFEMRANVYNVRNSYVPSADGQRFLVNTLLDSTGEPLTVILNWKPR